MQKLRYLMLFFVLCTVVLVTNHLNAVTHSNTTMDLTQTQAISVYRNGLANILTYMAQNKVLFPEEASNRAEMIASESREELRHLWARFSDYMIVLDHIIANHRQFYRLQGRHKRAQMFNVLYQAFIVQYRFALTFIEQMEKSPSYSVVLNEAMPKSGLPAASYDQLKYRFLHLGRASQFAAFSVVYKAYTKFGPLTETPVIADDSQAIWDMGKGPGERLTFINALNILQQTAFSTWFPVQKEVSEWMGDTKVFRRDSSLITQTQIQTLAPQLQPGDILLARREWYLSNVGLPGYWPHAALYIGQASQRQAYFDDPSVHVWVQAQGIPSGRFEDLLKSSVPVAYAASLTLLPEGHPAKIIEAISEGVSFTSLEHSAAADSLVVLRARLSKVEKARAIHQAFLYQGRPYDFNFDFRTDQALVCTELIYKSFEPSKEYTGIRLNTRNVLQRPIVSANDIVEMMDKNWGSAQQQLDLIAFIDGREWQDKAVQASITAFRASWKRPKWHLFLNAEE